MGVGQKFVNVWVGVAQLGVSSIVSLVGWLVAAPLLLCGGLEFFGFLEQIEPSLLPGLTANELVLAAAQIVYLVFLLALLVRMSLPSGAAKASWVKKVASCFPMFLGWAVLVGLVDQGILSLGVWSVQQQYLAGFSRYIFYGVWFGLLVFVSCWVLRVLLPNKKKHAGKSDVVALVLSMFVLVLCLGVIVWMLNSWYVAVESMPFSLVSAGRSLLVPLWEEPLGPAFWPTFALEVFVKVMFVLVSVSFWRTGLEVDENR